MNRITEKIITGLFSCILLLFLLACLNRSGSLIMFWQEKPLGKITHDEGFGYYSYMPDENISALKLPVYLKEDDSFPEQGLLSVNEDITATIKKQGGGRYITQSNNDIYFSASDNNPDIHEYSVVSPLIIQNRFILALLCLVIISAAIILFICRKRNNYVIVTNTVLWTATCCFLMMILPWNKLIFPSAPTPVGGLYFKPLLQRNIFFVFLFLCYLAVINKKPGNRKIFRILSAILVIWCTICYFVPEWNLFGRRNDSRSYLQPYSAASIRTPGYPIFIESIYKLSGNPGLEEIRNENAETQDETLLNVHETDSSGLIIVTRSQKIVLGLSFLFFYWIFTRYYAPLWFTLFAQIVLCNGFLGVDNSYIMSECLSQSAMLLSTGFFLLTMKEKNPRTFLLLCIFSALGVLIRPANIFLIIPILICLLFLMLKSKKSALLPIGCLAFLLLISVPAMNIYSHYGVFVWMPTSGYAEIGRAVELMQPGDEELFTDPELKDFCEELLKGKQLHQQADQNTYVWEIALPAAEARGYDRISASSLFNKISRKIFSVHLKEFFTTLSETVLTALQRTRLQLGQISFPIFLILFTGLFALRVNENSLIGLLFVFLHLVHLGISMVNQPERRYIYSTEILCLFGWLLILYNFVSTFNLRKNIQKQNHPKV